LARRLVGRRYGKLLWSALTDNAKSAARQRRRCITSYPLPRVARQGWPTYARCATNIIQPAHSDVGTVARAHVRAPEPLAGLHLGLGLSNRCTRLTGPYNARTWPEGTLTLFCPAFTAADMLSVGYGRESHSNPLAVRVVFTTQREYRIHANRKVSLMATATKPTEYTQEQQALLDAHAKAISERAAVAADDTLDTKVRAGKLSAATKAINDVEYMLEVEGIDYVPFVPVKHPDMALTDEQIAERVEKLRAAVKRGIPSRFTKRSAEELRTLSSLAKARGIES